MLTVLNRSPFAKAIILAAICIGYTLLGQIGLELATINQNVSPIWPASGFAIGSIIAFGPWVTPAIFLGAFLTNYSVGTPLFPLLTISTGNTLEAVVGGLLFVWIIKKNSLKHYSEFVATVTVASISTIVSATFGAVALKILSNAPGDFSDVWYTWWSGDAIGILIILPMLNEMRTAEFKNLTPVKFFNGLILTCVMTIFIYLVFVKTQNQAFVWSLTPIFVLTGLISGRFFSRLQLIFVSMLIVALTAWGYGPFELGNVNNSLIYGQTLLVTYAMAVLFVRPLESDYKFLNRYMIGISISWLILFIVTYSTSYYEKVHSLDDFRHSADSAMASLTKTTHQYEQLLIGAKALFASQKKVTEEEWRAYIKTVNANSYFNAINGLGYIKQIDKKDAATFEKQQNLKIKTINQAYADQFSDGLVINYIEPFKGNETARGLDIGSEPRRRAAAERAKETGKITSTEPIFLVQDNLKRNGFLIMDPIITQQNHFMGWVYSPVLSPIFFSKSLDQYAHWLRVKISVKNKVIYKTDANNDEQFKKNDFYFRKDVELFGRKHKIEFYPTQVFFSRHSGYSSSLALLLNLFMLFIAAFLLEQATFHQKAEVLVIERTRELEASKMQLVQSSKMASLGEMASGMAHEINNPLAIIQGKVKVLQLLLQDEKITSPLIIKEIDKIKQTTDRIEKIVSGLRNFSRASTKDPFEFMALDKLMQETLDLCSEKFKAEGIQLKIEKIPGVYIKCRPSQISQVLVNLFNNSRDAILDLEQKWIEVKFIQAPNSMLTISVIDSGNGIPDQVAERIMEPFFTTKEVRKGTGLGLSIAKGIMDSHGGQFYLDRNHPHTRFVIEIRFYTKELTS